MEVHLQRGPQWHIFQQRYLSSRAEPALPMAVNKIFLFLTLDQYRNNMKGE